MITKLMIKNGKKEKIKGKLMEEKISEKKIERTFVMVKPDVANDKEKVEKIKEIIKNAGLKILVSKKIKMPKKRAKIHYKEHKDKPFFNELIDFITSGYVIKMVVEGENAIEKMRELSGATDPKKAKPGTIRALFGTDIGKNAIHSSDSLKSAKREIKTHFHF